MTKSARAKRHWLTGLLACAALGFTAAALGAGDLAALKAGSVVATQACLTAASPLGKGAAPAGMVLVPAGAFIMGDRFDEGLTNERPTHVVVLPAFCLDTNLVCKALWDQVYQWGVARNYKFASPGAAKGREHPVHKVDWFDAVKWCNARSEMEGRPPAYYNDAGLTQPYRQGQSVPQINWHRGYRLPTEAEWEKAARGGLVSKRFPTGDTISHSEANYYSAITYQYDVCPTRGYHPSYTDGAVPYTSPVGSFAPNGFGIFDASGNLRQWCWDSFGPVYYASSPQGDPKGPANSATRVVRGGSWFINAAGCRVACRAASDPAAAVTGIGFRCAMSAPQN